MQHNTIRCPLREPNVPPWLLGLNPNVAPMDVWTKTSERDICSLACWVLSRQLTEDTGGLCKQGYLSS